MNAPQLLRTLLYETPKMLFEWQSSYIELELQQEILSIYSSSGHTWEIHEKYLRNTWEIHEKYLWNTWEIHEKTWIIPEKYLRNTWKIPEKCEVVINVLCSSVHKYICSNFRERLHEISSWLEGSSHYGHASHVTNSCVQEQLRIHSLISWLTEKEYDIWI